MKKVLLFLIFLIGITGCSKKSNNQNIENNNLQTTATTKFVVNSNSQLIETKVIDGLEFSNVSVVITENLTNIILTVKNTNNYDYNLSQCIIVAYDKDGNEIARIPSYVGETINMGDSKILNSSIDIELSNAFAFNYEIIK